jgi:hypothetical protein
MTRTKTTTKAAPAEKPATKRDELIAAIAANKDFIAATAECDRLTSDLYSTQAKLDQELAAASDVDNLVEKIEGGEQLEANDTAVQIGVLKDHVKAFTIASNRAEAKRKKVLQSISAELSAPLAVEHRERLTRIADAMSVLCDETALLPEFPSVLRSVNLDPGNNFPMFGLEELQRICPRLKYIRHSYQQFLDAT